MIEQLENKSTYDPNTGCLLWFGAMDSCGYGNINYKGKTFKAHRLSYMLNKNIKLLKHQLVCHKCDTPQCINPDHMFVGSQMDNMIDAKIKGRNYKKNNFCKNGHELIGDNLRISYSNHYGRRYKYRVCKSCAHNKYKMKRVNHE